jgi:hypothetical protein
MRRETRPKSVGPIKSESTSSASGNVYKPNNQHNSSHNNDAADVVLTRTFTRCSTAAFITKISFSVRRLDLKLLKLNSYFTPLRLYRFASAAGALPADQTGQQQHLDRDGSPRGELS